MGAFGDRSEPGARVIAFKAADCDGWDPLLRGYRASNIIAASGKQANTWAHGRHFTSERGKCVYSLATTKTFDEILNHHSPSNTTCEALIRWLAHRSVVRLFILFPKLVREMWRARYLWGTLNIFFTQQVPSLCWFMSHVYVCACFLLDF